MKNQILHHRDPEKNRVHRGKLKNIYYNNLCVLCVFVTLWYMVLCGFAMSALAQYDADISDEELFLYVGEVKPFTVNHPSRIVIPKPDIIDVVIVSDSQMLIKAKSVGSSDLIIWEKDASRSVKVDVVDIPKEDVQQRLKDFLDLIGLKNKVQITQKGDILLLTGRVETPEDFSRLEQILAKFTGVLNLVNIQDIKPLVELNVEILELSRNYRKNLGIDWTDQVKLTEQKGTGTGMDAFRIAGFSRGTALTAIINTLVSEGKGRILSNPRLVTVSGKKATSFVGGQIPLLTSVTTSTTTGQTGTSTTQGIQYRDYGINLEITPKVIEGTDKINTELFIEVSSIDQSVAITVQGVSNPGFKTRNTSTEIVTSSGDTIIISGLIQSDESKVADKVPALADIPILGNLFKSIDFKRGDTELVITITPHIVKQNKIEEEKVQEPSSDIYLRYAKGISNIIAASLVYPNEAKDMEIEGDIRLSLLIKRDGTLKDVSVVKSSGYDILDEEAKGVANKLSPYPYFPEGIKEDELWIDVPVVFNLD